MCFLDWVLCNGLKCGLFGDDVGYFGGDDGVEVEVMFGEFVGEGDGENELVGGRWELVGSCGECECGDGDECCGDLEVEGVVEGIEKYLCGFECCSGCIVVFVEGMENVCFDGEFKK